MIEGIFSLAGVIIGGVITAITSYLLHKSEVKDKKQERIELKQEELYFEIEQLTTSFITTMAKYNKITVNPNKILNIISKLKLYGNEKLIMLFSELGEKAIKYNTLSDNKKDQYKEEIKELSLELTSLFRKKFKIPLD